LPNYNDTVTISARVSEPLNASGIKLVTLRYWNGSAWTDVKMTLENNIYTAVISPLPFGTAVNYTVRAFDNAQNTAAVDIYSYEVVDMFPPTAKIDGLTQTALKSVVPVKVSGADANFDRMELYISGQLVQSWNQSGSEVYYWDTTKYPDGDCTVKLIVYDKSNNTGEKEIHVNIQNVEPGLSLSLIAIATLSIAILTLTGLYSARRKKGATHPSLNAVLQIKNTVMENAAAKIIIRLALIGSAVWFGIWIASELVIWHKPLAAAMATSLTNVFGLAIAILLLASFELLQRFQRVKSAKKQ